MTETRIENYFNTLFSMKMEAFQGTLYMKNKQSKEYLKDRNFKLCDDAYNISVITECEERGNKFGGIHQHYGFYLIATKKRLFVVLTYLNDELLCPFPMCCDPTVMDEKSIVEKVKELRDEAYPDKQVKVELVKFYTPGKILTSDGSVINEYGKFDYIIMRDPELGEKNGEDFYD